MSLCCLDSPVIGDRCVEEQENWAGVRALAAMLPTHEEARGFLSVLGVPDEALAAHDDADLPGLICTLDSLMLVGCAHTGLRHFLRAPSDGLAGRSPQDLLTEPNGVERLRALIHAEISAHSV